MPIIFNRKNPFNIESSSYTPEIGFLLPDSELPNTGGISFMKITW